jgi:hypothetical protein
VFVGKVIVGVDDTLNTLKEITITCYNLVMDVMKWRYTTVMCMLFNL